MIVGHYTRKPQHVEAVRVTAENMSEIAAWCKGELAKSTLTKFAMNQGEATLQECVQVPVIRPLNDRLRFAFVGDYVVKSGNSFRVYVEKVFTASFFDQNGTP
jgi:hypothetical protein